jgi:CHAD domain-containing protein
MVSRVPLGRAPGLVLSAGDGVGAAARAAVGFHLRRARLEEVGARRGRVEGVHQLRVATRRLRAVLRLLAPVLPAGFVRGGRDELAWLGTTIGQVRDLDVLAQTVRARAAGLEPESRRALGPLALALHDTRVARHAALVSGLDSTRCRTLLARLTAFVDSSPPARQQPLGAVAAELVQPLLDAVRRTGRRVTADSPPELFHRLRVRVKRLRYALETLQGLGGKVVAKTVRALVRLQDELGEGQDAVVAIAWLRAYVDTATVPPAAVLATGGVIEALARRGRKLARRFPEAWARLDRRRLWAGVIAELREERRPPLRAGRAVPALRSTGS